MENETNCLISDMQVSSIGIVCNKCRTFFGPLYIHLAKEHFKEAEKTIEKIETQMEKDMQSIGLLRKS